jgi:hypothetical protein
MEGWWKTEIVVVTIELADKSMRRKR